MKLNVWINLLLLLVGPHFSPSIFAHPEDSPLTFIPHKSEDGRVIYTNIPKRCFSNGLLTCPGRNPIFGVPSASKRVESKSTSTSTVMQKASPPSASVSLFGPAVKLSDSGNLCHAKGSQYYEQTIDYTSYSSIEECEAARVDN